MNKDWDKPLKISLCTSKLILIAPDGGDSLFGFRENLQANKTVNAGSKKIYCFGGSTTFGHGVDSKDTWPSVLKNNTGSHIINCGIVKSDLKSSLHTLVDLLRLGHKPDAIIFLDGVNESSGYTYWVHNQSNYIDLDTNYVALNHFYEAGRLSRFRLVSFVSFLFRARGINFILNFLKNYKIIFKNQEKNGLHKLKEIIQASVKVFKDHNKIVDFKFTSGERTDMVFQAAQSYLRSKSVIQIISEAYGIKNLFFFLQPTLFDLSSNTESNGRHIYLKDLYSEITNTDPEVIDISNDLSVDGIAILPEMFYDWAHLDEKGNYILAKIIEKNIRLHSNLL